MKSATKAFMAVISFCLISNVAQAENKAEVLWLGQATTKITTPGGKVIVIDPFLIKNPKTPAAYKDLAKLGKVDLILVTHGHFDHTADLGALAKLTGAKVVGNGALPRQLAAFGVVPKAQTISMNKTGTIMPIGDGVKIHMVPAEHSSALTLKNPDTGKAETVYAGAPVGYVIEMENGKTIYHSGDTGIFGDMSLIHDLYKPDLALVAIGGHFTMAPREAALAMTKYVKPKTILPIHYGTFPPLKGTPEQLKAAMSGSSIEILDVQPGQAYRF
ncbi:MAG: metal-dependent hydrolase [Sneathiella sp.]